MQPFLSVMRYELYIDSSIIDRSSSSGPQKAGKFELSFASKSMIFEIC